MTPLTLHTSEGRPRALHTPYHALGDAAGVRVPAWAERREVYRTGDGRTVYLVETTCPELARHDLLALARAGWEVTVDRPAGDAPTRITMVQEPLAQVA